MFKLSRSSKLLGWVICLLAALFYCYEYLLRIEPSLMVPQLMSEFGVTAGGLGLLSAMYYYAYTPMQAVVGMVIDYYGSRYVLVTAVAICGIGNLLFGMSHSVFLAGLGRLLIGLGSAFAFVGVLKLTAVWLPKKWFGIMAGITTSLGMVGAMMGDIEMSRLVQHLGWHKVISAGVVIAAFLLVLFIAFVRDKKEVHADAFQGGVPQLLLNFYRIVRNRDILLAGSIGCCLYLSLTVFAEMWGIPYIQSLTHSPTLAAKINSAVFFGWLVGAPLMGWLSNALRSRRTPMIFGGVLAAFTFLLILFIPHLSVVTLSVLLFLFGVFSSAEVLAFVIAREVVGTRLTATAVSIINLLVMLGGMVIQPIVGYMLGWEWHSAKFTLALLVVPFFMLLASGLALILNESYGRRFRRDIHA